MRFDDLDQREQRRWSRMWTTDRANWLLERLPDGQIVPVERAPTAVWLIDDEEFRTELIARMRDASVPIVEVAPLSTTDRTTLAQLDEITRERYVRMWNEEREEWIVERLRDGRLLAQNPRRDLNYLIRGTAIVNEVEARLREAGVMMYEQPDEQIEPG